MTITVQLPAETFDGVVCPEAIKAFRVTRITQNLGADWRAPLGVLAGETWPAVCLRVGAADRRHPEVTHS